MSYVEVKLAACVPSNMRTMSSEIPDQKDLMKRVRNLKKGLANHG